MYYIISVVSSITSRRHSACTSPCGLESVRPGDRAISPWSAQVARVASARYSALARVFMIPTLYAGPLCIHQVMSAKAVRSTSVRVFCISGALTISKMSSVFRASSFACTSRGSAAGLIPSCSGERGCSWAPRIRAMRSYHVLVEQYCNEADKIDVPLLQRRDAGTPTTRQRRLSNTPKSGRRTTRHSVLPRVHP